MRGELIVHVETILPTAVERLAPRQREMMRVIYADGGATIRDIHSRIPDPPRSICGLRTQLNRLAKRGLLRTRSSGRHSEIVYLPSECSPDVQLSAFARIADDHFGGSATRALRALTKLAAHEEARRFHIQTEAA